MRGEHLFSGDLDLYGTRGLSVSVSLVYSISPFCNHHNWHTNAHSATAPQPFKRHVSVKNHSSALSLGLKSVFLLPSTKKLWSCW